MATNPYVNKVEYGGTTLIDITDTTAEDADVAEGKVYYKASGLRSVGTASGGGGGGGLEYEEGEWVPAEDVNTATIPFSKTHTKPPFTVLMADITGGQYDTSTYLSGFFYSETSALWGAGMPSTTANAYAYGGIVAVRASRQNLTNSNGFRYDSNTSGSTTTYPRYFVTESGFTPKGTSTSHLFKAGRTYKWIAIWAS